MTHYYSIDLESWTHSPAILKAFPKSKDRKKIDNGKIKKQINDILNILDKQKTKATWFIVSEIYEWYPKEIENIHKEGHEIGFHTYSHKRINSPEILKDELNLSDEFIKKFRVKGFRAPTLHFSLEGHKKLSKTSLLYSSSTYSDERPFKLFGTWEIPVSSYKYKADSNRVKSRERKIKSLNLSLMFHEIPFGSGIFLGAFGTKPTIWGINQYEKNGRSANLFVHSWQIADEGKEARLSRLKHSIRHPLFLPYTRIVKNEFIEILRSYKFTKISNNPIIHSKP